MKAYSLVDTGMFTPPFKNTLEEMWQEHLLHCIQLPSGEIGFLIRPKIAIVPVACARLGLDVEVTLGDGSKSKAHCLGETRMFGIGAYYVHNTPNSENLTYRVKSVHKDTFLFRADFANDNIRTSALAQCDFSKNMTIRYSEPSDFLPVFDQHSHFVGVTVGTYQNVLICIDAHDITHSIV